MTPEERKVVEKKIADFFKDLNAKAFIIGVSFGGRDQYYKGGGPSDEMTRMSDEIHGYIHAAHVTEEFKRMVS